MTRRIQISSRSDDNRTAQYQCVKTQTYQLIFTDYAVIKYLRFNVVSLYDTITLFMTGYDVAVIYCYII